MSDKIEVKLVVARGTRFKHGDRVLFTISPEYGYLIEEIEQIVQAKFDLPALGFALPPDAIRFYAVESSLKVDVAPELKHVEINPDVQRVTNLRGVPLRGAGLGSYDDGQFEHTEDAYDAG